MAKITHNTSIPNDGLGDALRTAFSNQNSMNTELYADKVDKVVGKDLSSNNYDNASVVKLANIAEGAEVNVQSDWNQSDNLADDYIKNKPDLSGTITGFYENLFITDGITNDITIPSGVVVNDVYIDRGIRFKSYGEYTQNAEIVTLVNVSIYAAGKKIVIKGGYTT